MKFKFQLFFFWLLITIHTQIEGKHGYHGCYYLYENMKENEDYTYGLVADEKPEGVYDAYALPGEFTHSCGELCCSLFLSFKPPYLFSSVCGGMGGRGE